MKVAILCGGTSTERDVSISSGKLICEALIKKGYEAILLDSYLGIESKILKGNPQIFTLGSNGIKQDLGVSETVPNIETIKKLRANPDEFFGPNVLNICKQSDIVFIALHGENGENGKVQATLDLLNIKYTGTGYVGSMLAMDKGLTRKMLATSSVAMAEGIILEKKDKRDCSNLLPAVVKPANGGSSVGVSIVNTIQELNDAICNARKIDTDIIVERYIKGREFSVGIIDKEALPIIEIKPLKGFYDYKNKYQAGLTKEICPADLSKEIALKMKKAALEVYSLLELKVYARIDFIVSDDNTIYCLEANTLPGMTPTSLLPQEAEQINISYGELCDKIIKLSLRK